MILMNLYIATSMNVLKLKYTNVVTNVLTPLLDITANAIKDISKCQCKLSADFFKVKSRITIYFDLYFLGYLKTVKHALM